MKRGEGEEERRSEEAWMDREEGNVYPTRKR